VCIYMWGGGRTRTFSSPSPLNPCKRHFRGDDMELHFNVLQLILAWLTGTCEEAGRETLGLEIILEPG
jgi:hypothetical protein